MLCCIGGVCVPYTAVVPIIILGLKWIAQKLANYGILPSKIADLLQIKPQPNGSVAGGEIANGGSSCCTATTTKSLPPVSPEDNVVITLESSEQWDDLLKQYSLVVCKFTAVWCQPCKKIQPLLEQLAVYYTSGKQEEEEEKKKDEQEDEKIAFVIVDVDDHDDIANKYNVAMMPTFLVLEQGGKVKDTYRGSNEAELRNFLQSNL